MIETPTTTLPAPVISVPLPAPTKWEREYQAFRQLLPELLKTHAGQYVAIHDGEVFDCGTDKIELAVRVLKKVGNVSIHVGLVSDQPTPISRSGLRREIHRPGGSP
jgi:hypothetical protein